jgi:sulfate transport system permease protein
VTVVSTQAPDGPTAPAVARRARSRAVGGARVLRPASAAGLGLVTLWLSLVVLIPLAAVVVTGAKGGWSGFVDAVTTPAALAALTLSAGLALVVALVNAVVGTTIAWVLVRDPFPGSKLLDNVIDVPFALPTIVTGVVMLALFGPESPVDVNLVGTRVGLVVTLLFVTLPFTVRTVQPVLASLDRDAEQAAESLGASGGTVFRRVVLPVIGPAIASGASLAFARALGEYGSLVLISSNIPKHTQVASALIYGKLEDATNPVRSTQQAASLAIVLLAVSVLVLVAVELLHRKGARRG